mmetsp:Transcript_95104/g.307932  ORF Transcript_95104/g.307932 Transcript_95104/m.307932 type:complete len:590 (-) Transcript_95104:362-2131(-)
MQMLLGNAFFVCGTTRRAQLLWVPEQQHPRAQSSQDQRGVTLDFERLTSLVYQHEIKLDVVNLQTRLQCPRPSQRRDDDDCARKLRLSQELETPCCFVSARIGQHLVSVEQLLDRPLRLVEAHQHTCRHHRCLTFGLQALMYSLHEQVASDVRRRTHQDSFLRLVVFQGVSTPNHGDDVLVQPLTNNFRNHVRLSCARGSEQQKRRAETGHLVQKPQRAELFVVQLAERAFRDVVLKVLGYIVATHFAAIVLSRQVKPVQHLPRAAAHGVEAPVVHRETNVHPLRRLQPTERFSRQEQDKLCEVHQDRTAAKLNKFLTFCPNVHSIPVEDGWLPLLKARHHQHVKQRVGIPEPEAHPVRACQFRDCSHGGKIHVESRDARPHPLLLMIDFLIERRDVRRKEGFRPTICRLMIDMEHVRSKVTIRLQLVPTCGHMSPGSKGRATHEADRRVRHEEPTRRCVKELLQPLREERLRREAQLPQEVHLVQAGEEVHVKRHEGMKATQLPLISRRGGRAAVECESDEVLAGGWALGLLERRARDGDHVLRPRRQLASDTTATHNATLRCRRTFGKSSHFEELWTRRCNDPEVVT